MSVDEPYPPLVSPRSPSYARARREFLHPSPTGDAQVVALLAQLSEAEENAGQACSKAAEMLVDESLATRARDDASTHRARRRALGEMIEALGGSAPRPDECREVLTHGADAVARATSDTDAIEALRAMRAELSAAYDAAIRSPLLDDVQRASLARLA